MNIKAEIAASLRSDELLDIVRQLVKIPSHSALPEREIPIACYLKELFDREGIEACLQEVVDGRPNVIAVLKGCGGGSSLMLNGHIDTVPPFGMEQPFAGIVKDGWLWGRGAADMKAGVGAMAYALIALKRRGVKLKGDLLFAGVIDEDAAGSAGTRFIVANGPKADYAIVGEPTKLLPVTAHKGIDYFKVIFRGRAAHSSVPQKGVNAIYSAARFITKVERELIPEYEQLQHPLVGAPTVNLGLVQGCAQANKGYLTGQSATFAGIVPDLCEVYLDIRWTPYQNIREITGDVERVAHAVAAENPEIKVTVEYIPLPRPAMEASPGNLLVKSLIDNAGKTLGRSLSPEGVMFWADSGLLYGLGGIPTVVLGPGDIAVAHSENECVEISQLIKAAQIYSWTALDVCGYQD